MNVTGAIMAVALPLNMAAVADALYVAPGGNDAAPGTFEQPLASLAGARDAVRKTIAADKGVLQEPATVFFRRGTYVLHRGRTKNPFANQALTTRTARRLTVRRW